MPLFAAAGRVFPGLPAARGDAEAPNAGVICLCAIVPERSLRLVRSGAAPAGAATKAAASDTLARSSSPRAIRRAAWGVWVMAGPPGRRVVPGLFPLAPVTLHSPQRDYGLGARAGCAGRC